MRYLQVGLGNIGAKRASVLGARCVGTVDPLNPRATFGSCEQADGLEFEAVILSVPNHAKVHLVERFLSRGVHVLVEKPLLLTSREEVGRIVGLARERNVACVTSYNHRFEPGIQKLKDLLTEGAIGNLYYGRLHYGNGTARNLVGTWREAGAGVLEDLACHLLDLDQFLFPESKRAYRAGTVRQCELNSWDYAMLLSDDGALQLEVSYLDWRNTFTIDLFGERGSLHLDGLLKWFGSRLVQRMRVYPSGVPREQVFSFDGPDTSWDLDVAAFERSAAEGRTTLEEDWQISAQIMSVLSAERKYSDAD